MLKNLAKCRSLQLSKHTSQVFILSVDTLISYQVYWKYHSMMLPMSHRGFTLAELLIALAILGVIATFVIPKLLSNSQQSQNNAIAKETISSISVALQMSKLAGTATNLMTGNDLTPYLNYVAIVTDGTVIDERPNYGFVSDTCTVADPCLRLHNGALLKNYGGSFASTVGGGCPTGFVGFTLDPDGYYTGKRDSLRIALSYEGRAGSRSYACNGTGATADDPTWFNW